MGRAQASIAKSINRLVNYVIEREIGRSSNKARAEPINRITVVFNFGNESLLSKLWFS